MQPLLALVLALSTFCCVAQASTDADSDLYRLQQIQLMSQATLSDFYLLYGIEQNPELALNLEQHIITASTNLLGLQPQSGSGANAQLAQLKHDWLRYAQNIKQLSAGLHQQVIPSPHQLLELITLQQQLLEQTSALISAQGAEQTSPSNVQLSLLLQNLSTHYIAYSIGANALGSSPANIDELTAEFSSALQQHGKQLTEQPENQQVFATIQRKWRYIEPPLQHYNSRPTVPYLVNRYTGRIIQLLNQLQTRTSAQTLSQSPAS